MSALDEKLINYGGLAHFHDQMINDSAKSDKATWSSEKIDSEISALAGTMNSELEGKEAVDFTFVNALPQEGEEDQCVIIKGENADSLYKYTSGAWAEQTPDATKLYFDTEHEALYSYVTADHQFAQVSMVNTYVVGSNLNTNAALKTLKTPGVYSVVQRLHSATKGDYIKNWTLYVESVDYEEYDSSDSVYQRLVSNYTIQKRTWSATRATNDGWSNFSTYYAGEIKDTTTSKYYTWSSNKLSSELAAKQDVISDLATIRSGAALGATALQSVPAEYVTDTELSTALAAKQDVISDLATIRSGAALGATALQAVPAEYVTETEMEAAIAAIPQLEAGDNISIESNKINAKGYFYDDEPKAELKLIDDILTAAGMPAGQSLGLKVSGAAGATTYTWSDTMGGYFARLIQFGMLPGVGATYQTTNGKSGVIAAVDDTTITFEETLDADNALTDEPVDYVVEAKVLNSFAEGELYHQDASTLGATISGAAGATTYTYSGGGPAIANMFNNFIKAGAILELANGKTAEYVSIDTTGNTITVAQTFDADNAISNVQLAGYYAKPLATGQFAHAEGGMIVGTYSNPVASGMGSHAEGSSIASGICSHAEGAGTTASGVLASHAEGNRTTASGTASHAEGEYTTASGATSHAEGTYTTASGNCSHAEGEYTTASGLDSHAEGYYNIAQNADEHAEGRYNVSHKASDTYGDAGNTQHTIGIGSGGARKNAFEIMQNGDAYLYGVGGYQGTNTKVQDATIKTLQEYITALETRIAALETQIANVASNSEINQMFNANAQA